MNSSLYRTGRGIGISLVVLPMIAGAAEKQDLSLEQRGAITPTTQLAFNANERSVNAAGNADSPSASATPSRFAFGYIGFNAGVPEVHTSCYAPYSCNNASWSGKVYTGGAVNQWLGLEGAYLDWGSAERNGGHVKARAVNLSLVGNLPLNEVFHLFGKVGATYGWTDTEVSPALLSVNRGAERGFGLSYGAGLAFNITPTFQIVGEWDRHNLKFSQGRSDIDMYAVGIKFKF